MQWWSERLHSDKLHKGGRYSSILGRDIELACPNLNAGIIENFFSQNLIIKDERKHGKSAM